MVKNAIIKIDGVSTVFTAIEKIRTKSLFAGGYETWLWDDGTQLTELHASANEEHDAEDDGYYGYSVAIVSGIGVAEFVAKEGDKVDGQTLTPGKTYRVEKDSETKKLIVTQLD